MPTRLVSCLPHPGVWFNAWNLMPWSRQNSEPFPQNPPLNFLEGRNPESAQNDTLSRLGRCSSGRSTFCARLQAEADPISLAQLTIRNGATISGAPDSISISLGAHLDSLTEVYKGALLPICSDGTRMSFPIPARFGELDADTGSPKLPFPQGELAAPKQNLLPIPIFPAGQRTDIQATYECLDASMPRYQSCEIISDLISKT
jgi:hypothetical protein